MCTEACDSQCRCQKMKVVHCRFATGDYNDSCAARLRTFRHLAHPDTWMGFRIPGFLHITPGTTHIATRQPYKIGCLTLKETFTLNGVKVFHQRKGCLRIGFNGSQMLKG